MEMSSGEWLSDLAMEDPISIIQHCQMMINSSQQIHNEELINSWYDPTHLMLFDTETTSLTTYNDPQPLANSGWSSCASTSRNSEQLISFGGSDDCDNNQNDEVLVKDNYNKEEPIHFGEDYFSTLENNNKLAHQKQKKRVFGSSSTSVVCSQEHVIAERKRREKMAYRFHALSALIPGLKKMHKASILEDAAKYLKQLEDQVKQLEEQTSKRIVESVVLVKKIQDQNNLNDGNSFSDENFDSSMNPLLEVEARASNKNVLIRIHARKLEGLARKVFQEIEKFHLTTLNCNTMSFGGYATDITIIAKMNDEFCLTMEDLVKHLRQALQQFSCMHTKMTH